MKQTAGLFLVGFRTMKKSSKIHINSILVIVYLMLTWAAYTYTHREWGIATSMVFLLVPFLFLVLLIPPLLEHLSGVSLGNNKSLSRRKKAIFFLSVSAICAVFFLVLWAAADYGFFSNDSASQLKQAQTGVYNDWHPVWHTLLFFTLPLKLTGQIKSLVLFQIILFSLCLGFMAVSVLEFSGLRFTMLALCTVLLNPSTMAILLFPWKDVAFALATLVSTVCVLRIWCGKKDDWSRKAGGLIMLGLSLGNAALFRHNGVLFSGFLAIALAFVLTRKQWMMVLLSALLMFAAVKGPVYSALHVEQPDRRTVETVGLPLTVIQSVVVRRPDVLDTELQEFADSVAPREDWEEYFASGNFNPFKFGASDQDAIDRAGTGTIVRLMFKCFRLAPKEALMGFLDLTDLVYSVEGESHDLSEHLLNLSGFSVPTEGGRRIDLHGVMAQYIQLYHETIFAYTEHIGFALLIMLVIGLAKSRLNRWEDWKRILLVLPIFAYDFATMLLLTGWDYRFFYATFLVCPLYVLLFLYQGGEQESASRLTAG